LVTNNKDGFERVSDLDIANWTISPSRKR